MKKLVCTLLISSIFMIGAPIVKADVNENASPSDAVTATPSDVNIKNPNTGVDNYVIPALLLISGLGATIKYGHKKYLAKI